MELELTPYCAEFGLVTKINMYDINPISYKFDLMKEEINEEIG